LPAFEAEEDAGDLAGGQIDGRHDHAVEEKSEEHRAEAANEACGRARVADLVELEVCEHAGTPPESRVEKHGRHAGEHEGPPHPVAGDTSRAHDVGPGV